MYFIISRYNFPACFGLNKPYSERAVFSLPIFFVLSQVFSEVRNSRLLRLVFGAFRRFSGLSCVE